MLILIVILLVLLPAIVVAYPLLRTSVVPAPVEDEGSREAELARRWGVALDGLKSAELEYALGNLEEPDYRSIREQYMTEAALVLKAMELEEQQEQEFLDAIEEQARGVRDRILGREHDGAPGGPESPGPRNGRAAPEGSDGQGIVPNPPPGSESGAGRGDG